MFGGEGGWNQIQSPAHDFAGRRVNFSSAMHNYNERKNCEQILKNFQSVIELEVNEFSPQFSSLCI
jgi:hypothetical protein